MYGSVSNLIGKCDVDYEGYYVLFVSLFEKPKHRGDMGFTVRVLSMEEITFFEELPLI
jgi:hypothetical protein